jgi:hypothetical protein
MDAELPAAKKVPRNVKAKTATVKASRGAAMTTAATPEHAEDTRAASAPTGVPAKTRVGGTSKPAPPRRAAKASRGAANVAAAKPAGSAGGGTRPD